MFFYPDLDSLKANGTYSTASFDSGRKMILAFIVPGVACFVYAVVQAIRKHWSKSFLGILLTIIFLLLFTLLMESHTSAIRQARLDSYEKKIIELEKQIEEKKIGQ